MDLLDFFQYGFVQRAIISGSLIALTCSILGVFLILKRMSLIGDGLSHVSFGAIAVGLLFGIYPYYVAVPLVAVSSLAILKISEKARLYADASIGIVSATAIAIGVIIASISGGFNADLLSFLFGNILAISLIEVFFSVLMTAIVLFIVWFFYWDLFSSTYDGEYAAISGVNVSFINSVFTILTAVTVVLSVKVVGVMLVSALLIVPASAALQIAKGFKSTIVISSIISLAGVFAGIIISLIFNLPAGASIVLTDVLLFMVVLFYRKIILK